jgi:hypothetical protein
MNRVQHKSEIEIKAKQLLSSLQVTCPENLWQELNYRLNEEIGEREKSWKNNIYSPKILAFVLGGLGIIGVFVWRFLPQINDISAGKVGAVTNTQKPITSPPAKTPEPVKVIAPAPSKDTGSQDKATAPDTIKKAETATAPVATSTATTVATPTVAVTEAEKAAYYARRDSIRKTRKLWYARRDSLAKLKQDSVRAHGAAPSLRHDSVQATPPASTKDTNK